MKRLCLLCSDVDMTRRVLALLRHAGVVDSSLMVVARHDVRLDDLPTATTDKSDAIPGLARGLAAGGVVGTLAGLVVMSFEEPGFALGGAAIPMFALFGAAMSGLAGFLAGTAVPNSRLKPFAHAIEDDGKILLMIDVLRARGEELEKLVRDEVPEIEFADFEPRAPIIP